MTLHKCFLSVVVLVAVGTVVPSTVFPSVKAQDDSPTLEQYQQQWTELSEKLSTLEKKISTGDEADKAQTEYKKLAEQSEKIVAGIEASAKRALEADRTSSTAIRALMGLAVKAAEKNQDAKTLAIGDYLIGKGINPKYFEIAAKIESLSIEQKEIFDELLIRQKEALANDLPRVELTTTKGTVVVELFENEAPGTVGNFVSLVEKGYYDDMLFHRVLEGFMAQTGGYKLDKDNQETGGEGPGYQLKCECYEPDFRKHFTGSLSMAKKPNQKDSGGSQLFITLQRTQFLDGEHTVFGRILSGGDVMELLERTHVEGRGGEVPIAEVLKDKIVSAKVLRKRAHKYQPEVAKGGKSKSKQAVAE